MPRLCERPGCSEPASVAYGMRPEDLVFWLDVLLDDRDGTGGALCRRHADSMVVPRDWTLDDLRDPDLHLFRPPPIEEAVRKRARRPSRPDEPVEQLRLDAFDEPTADTEPETETEIESAPPHPEPWAPAFDSGDDLDGLLSARSPLLARAFRGDDRPAR